MLRFLPFSVKTGVMAGMGIVLLSLGLELCCEESMLDLESVGEIKEFVEWDTSKLWLPGAVAALLLFLTSAFVVDSPYTILVFFVVSISGIHLIRVFVLQQSLEEMIEAGWLFEPVQSGTVLSVWAGLDVNKIVWSVLADNMSTIGVAILVAPVLNNLGDLAVIKTVLPAKVMGEVDFNQEMEAQGRSHILLGMCGGFSTDYGNDDTIVHRKFGGLRRVSVYVHCVTLGIALVCPYVSIIIPYIPKFANGAIIALAGFEFLNESLVETYWQLQKSEYVVVVIFALLVLLTGGAIEKAILVGTFLGFGVFVVKYADVDQVKFIAGRSASTVSLPDNFRLNFCGLLDSVVKAKLSGFLFFGSTPAVIDRILENIAEIDNVVLIIDWAEVAQVDTAAVVEFERLEEAVESSGGIIVFRYHVSVPKVQSQHAGETACQPHGCWMQRKETKESWRQRQAQQ
jgi:MFS superfamily sulfate permease-like transporter